MFLVAGDVYGWSSVKPTRTPCEVKVQVLLATAVLTGVELQCCQRLGSMSTLKASWNGT